jgi:radical SAM protein with 4Fe4S-binding SPASM domain
VGNKKVHPAFMDYATHKKVIDLLPKSIIGIHYNYRGEATLNPDFAKMIKYAHEKCFRTSLSTNGMLIDKYTDELVRSGLDTILFAVDGSTRAAQEKYRIGSNLAKIKENIKLLVAARKASTLKYPREIIIQTIVTKYNEKQIPDIIETAKDLRVDRIVFKTLAINFGASYQRGKKFQESFLPKNQAYRRKHNLLFCNALRENAILYNGDISICCCDYQAEYVMGNIIKQNSFEKVVYSEKYNRIKRRILRRDLPICQNCPVTGGFWLPEISRVFN